MDSYPYSLSGCPASYDRQVDPVTVVFYGSGYASWALNHIQQHKGWSNQDGGTQYFSSHGQCGVMQGQRASDCGSCTRFHIRMRTTYDSDTTWGITSVGTPHHEDWIWYCGHAVDKGGASQGLSSGFDQGRQAIYDTFINISHHPFGGTYYWGNTREFKQCDNDYAGSNGNVVYFKVTTSS